MCFIQLFIPYLNPNQCILFKSTVWGVSASEICFVSWSVFLDTTNGRSSKLVSKSILLLQRADKIMKLGKKRAAQDIVKLWNSISVALEKI